MCVGVLWIHALQNKSEQLMWTIVKMYRRDGKTYRAKQKENGKYLCTMYLQQNEKTNKKAKYLHSVYADGLILTLTLFQ